MGNRQSDPQWILRQSVEAFSWTGISWFVALFAGLWGVMIGIGAFIPAYMFLAICLGLCAIKWGNSTGIHTPQRRVGAFALGILLLLVVGVAMVIWSHGRAVAAEEESRKLGMLTQIPHLTEQANRIPGMQKQLGSLPGMQQTIQDLQAANKAANDATSKKERIIEGLAQTVIDQNKKLAADVMGSGYAAVVPSLPVGTKSNNFELVVFNYAKGNMYEFHFSMIEAIYPNDDQSVTIAKMNAEKTCTVGTLYPGATRTNCFLSVPDQGGKYFVTLFDRRGEVLMEQYTFTKNDQGNLSLSTKFFTPAGKEMDRSALTKP